MKKIILLTIIIFVVSSPIFSQITEAEKAHNKMYEIHADTAHGWDKGVVFGANLAQASFNNWAAGGENSLAINGLLSAHANYRKGKNAWDNMLDLGYGILNQGDAGSQKTDDKIDINTKYGRLARKNLYYAALVNFKTQMTEGYDYESGNDSVAISNFMAPAYLISAIGMDYKPNNKITAFLAPLTSKMTIVNSKPLSDNGAYGVEPGEMMRSEFGGYLRIIYNDEYMDKTVSLLSKLELFTNYANNPENIDVSWENIIGFKVNKFISATITAQLIYDDDIKTEIDSNADGLMETRGAKLQFKEVIGIGLSYKF